MKVLLPITDRQTISIIPRSIGYDYIQDGYEQKVEAMRATVEDNVCADSVLGRTQGADISMELREDGSGKQESISNVSILEQGNYADVTFSATILTKDRTYSFEMKKGESLLYRGKIYCTDGFDGDNYNISKGLYKENSSNDNKYTLI